MTTPSTSRKLEHDSSADWIEHLTTAGLPDPGSDPLASPVKLSPLATEPIDHFELIWPSGDIDEEFGAETDEPFPHPDIDRAGVTARLVGRRRSSRDRAGGSAGNVDVDDDVDARRRASGDTLEAWLGDDDGREAITDDVVLAVRRAVASIDTGSLAARRRLVEPSGAASAETQLDAGPMTLPGRVAVHTDAPELASRAARGHVSGLSVFDNLPPGEQVSSGGAGSGDTGEGDDEGEPQRASALKRLIGSLRRR